MTYAKIRSWHAVRTFTRDGGILTVCGRRIPPPIRETWESDELPGDQKSCESCLRGRVRATDAAEAAEA